MKDHNESGTSAEQLYAAHYKGKGLAPKTVVALKAALKSALDRNKDPHKAARKFFKEKGITIDTAHADLVPKKDEEVPEDSKNQPKTSTNDKLSVLPLPRLEINKMDRKSLKSTIQQLIDAGIAVQYDKKDEDDVLRRKLNDALQALPSPKVIKMLESVDPAKLKSVLDRDCLGIFVDVRSASCVACPDLQSCTKAWLQNLKGDFKVLKAVTQEIKTEEAAKAVKKEDVAAVASKQDAKPGSGKATAVKWKADRFIAIMDVSKSDLDKTHATYETLRAIFKEVPTSFAALREIVERKWDVDNDDAFVQDWVLGLRELGYLKLESDLTPKERKVYEKAGYL